MTITEMSAVLPSESTTGVMNDVSTAMLSKSLDVEEGMGDSMVKMMEQSVNPYLGGNVDIRL